MKLAKKEGGARPWANTWRRANTKDQPAASVPSGRQAMASWPPELLQRRLTTMAVSRHQAASTYYSLVAPSYRDTKAPQRREENTEQPQTITDSRRYCARLT